MNNNLVWAKTLLCAYRYLERLADAVDKIIMESALGSGYVSMMNFHATSAEVVSQKLIDLSERKVTLVNLKVLIEDVLGQLREDEALILIDKFVDNLKTDEIAENAGVCQRTVFRKLDSGTNSFSRGLLERGYTDQKLENMLRGEAWIKNLYNTLAEKNEEIELSNSFLERAVRMK